MILWKYVFNFLNKMTVLDKIMMISDIFVDDNCFI